jgi:cytosine-specific methyltransferase
MGSNDTYIQVGTYRTHNDGKGFREVKSNIAPTIPARAREDGSGMPVIRQLPRGKNKENNSLGGIRRLTEIECERLQGFPDNWTQYGNYNGTIKPIAKTQRYKLIGNAVTVDIVELMTKRLNIIEQ